MASTREPSRVEPRRPSAYVKSRPPGDASAATQTLIDETSYGASSMFASAMRARGATLEGRPVIRRAP